MFVVVYPNVPPYFLRSTILSADAGRATRFPTEEAAQAGIAKARTFHKGRTIKSLRILEIEESELAALSRAYHSVAGEG